MTVNIDGELEWDGDRDLSLPSPGAGNESEGLAGGNTTGGDKYIVSCFTEVGGGELGS